MKKSNYKRFETYGKDPTSILLPLFLRKPSVFCENRPPGVSFEVGRWSFVSSSSVHSSFLDDEKFTTPISFQKPRRTPNTPSTSW